MSKLSHFFGEKLLSSNGKFYAFVGFLIIVFLTGGGSRDDIQSLVILRPLSILFAAYAFLISKKTDINLIKAPLIFLGLLAILMIVQLIPLPASIWMQLPNRQLFGEISDLAGMEQVWRPISMVPSRTLNSLFSLSVPLAILLLSAIQSPKHGRKIIGLFILLGGASALLGALQLTGSGRSAFYLYRVTNDDMPVGLLANRNHQAVLLSIMMLLSTWYFLSFRHMPNKKLEWARLTSILVPIFFLPLIVLTGSRLGLLVGAFAVFASGLMLYYRGYVSTDNLKAPVVLQFIAKRRVIITIGFVIAMVAVFALLFSDSLAVRRLISGNLLDDLRAEVFPVLLAMAQDHLVFGIGFGSFENVYRSYETVELLRPNYLNNAHNDWFQYVIEAGLGGVLLGIGFFGWLIRAVWRGYTSGSERKFIQIDFCLGIIAIFVMASFVDYPLRVPIMMALAAFCAARLSRSSTERV